jgi:hypothetical protein
LSVKAPRGHLLRDERRRLAVRAPRDRAFNNDGHGHAVRNAERLRALVGA